MALAIQRREDQEEPSTTSPPPPPPLSEPPTTTSTQHLLTSYIGLSFTLFLTSLPKSSLSLLNNDISFQLHSAQQQLNHLHSRRKEDSKANARVVEIFASHRHAWQQEEKRLLQQIDEAYEEIARLGSTVEELKAYVEELKREVRNREEMLSYITMRSTRELSGFERSFGGGECNYEEEEVMGTRCLSDKASHWQDGQYEPLESLDHLKYFVSRRESPWKVDGESTGVSSKLKLLEQELLILEKVGKSDVSKLPSLMRKQAKRYQALTGKIDNLCRTMQESDSCEPTLSSEFRTQRQTEFLLEAFRLQQRSSETGEKLMALQTESGKSYFGDELEGQTKLTTRRSLDSIRSNFKEIQRNLEIGLARIIGDLEGILSRDGASRVREYYMSTYPFVQ